MERAFEDRFSFVTSRSGRADMDTSAVTPDVDPCRSSYLTLLRARKFRALSTLFTLDVAHYEEAVLALLEPCSADIQCPVSDGSTKSVGLEALEWVRNVGNVSGLYAEHLRLFGGEDIKAEMPLIAAAGGLYAAEGLRENDYRVSAFYRRMGFTPRSDCPCPSYIANELEFMAFLLEQAVEGKPGSGEAAADFVVTHLCTWGIVFSAATHARSAHPVTRFAGLMLEHKLFCESYRARDLARGRLDPADSRPEPA